MSDPVTNVQIEDVLSSIRKLVSEEVRAQTQAARREMRPARPDAPVGKLILTPSFRVAASAGDADGEVEPKKKRTTVAPRRLVMPQTASPKADEGTKQGDDELAEAGFIHVTDDQDDDVIYQMLRHVNAPETEIGLAGHEGADVLSFSSEPDRLRNEAPKPVRDKALLDPATTPIAASAPEAKDDIPEFLRSRGVSSLEDRIAELEAAVSDTADYWEGEDEDLVGGLAMPWEDHLPQEDAGSDVAEQDYVVDAPQPAAEQDDHEAMSVLADDNAPLIDEEILRDLVGEIVRQELQGALGERITRNVRKLVRREIHRALTANDF